MSTYKNPCYFLIDLFFLSIFHMGMWEFLTYNMYRRPALEFIAGWMEKYAGARGTVGAASSLRTE